MTLTQLRYFLAVCQYENLTQAAKAIGVSQPSLSDAVRSLETEFHITLFQRKRRGMSLTTEAITLRQMAEDLLRRADEMHEYMAGLGSSRKRLRLGVPPMIGAVMLAPIYSEFLSGRRNLEVEIVESGRQELIAQFRENRLDMMLLPHDSPMGDEYGSMLICEMETVCCVADTHPLAGRTSITAQELADEPVILFRNSFFQTARIRRRFSEAGIEPNVILQTDQLSTVRAMIAGGAVGFLFRQLIADSSHLVAISMDPPMPLQVSLVWHAGRIFTAAEEEFRAYLQDHAPFVG